MNWNSERLFDVPESGSVPEAHFDGGMSGADWIWFLFDPGSSGEVWVGCFRGGDNTYDVTYAVPVPDRPQVLGATFTELFVLTASGVKWCEGRVAMDGITISEVTSSRAAGYAPTYYGDVPFETLRLTGGVQANRKHL
jgi:hypothetical protein